MIYNIIYVSCKTSEFLAEIVAMRLDICCTVVYL